jgi:hypothetical protein
MVPSRILNPLAAKCALITSKIFCVSSFASSKWRNLSSVVASGALSGLRSMSTKARMA